MVRYNIYRCVDRSGAARVSVSFMSLGVNGDIIETHKDSIPCRTKTPI